MSIARPKGDKGKCDVLFSKIIRSTGRCMRCGGSDYLQCSHIIGRSYSWTRTFLPNAQPLCASCHRYFTDHPVRFRDWLYSTIGESGYLALEKQAHEGVGKKFDWTAELARLKEVYKEVEAGTWHPSVGLGEELV